MVNLHLNGSDAVFTQQVLNRIHRLNGVPKYSRSHRRSSAERSAEMAAGEVADTKEVKMKPVCHEPCLKHHMDTHFSLSLFWSKKNSKNKSCGGCSVASLLTLYVVERCWLCFTLIRCWWTDIYLLLLDTREFKWKSGTAELPLLIEPLGFR